MVNRVKERLREGDYCIGVFVTIPSPAIVEIIGYAGFDFIIIDMEHGVIDYESVEEMVRAADLHRLTSIVRVQEARESYILRALETGANGVEVPHIDDREAAAKVVEAVKYAPLGGRGVSPYTRAAGYSSISPSEHFSRSNRETMIVLHIEGRRGVENLEEISDVDGVDVLFVGPYDLSQSYGVPGEVDDPRVIYAMNRLIDVCRSRGRWPGTFVPNIERAKKWVSAGMKYLAYSVDAGIFYESLRNITSRLRS